MVLFYRVFFNFFVDGLAELQLLDSSSKIQKYLSLRLLVCHLFEVFSSCFCSAQAAEDCAASASAMQLPLALPQLQRFLVAAFLDSTACRRLRARPQLAELGLCAVR